MDSVPLILNAIMGTRFFVNREHFMLLYALGNKTPDFKFNNIISEYVQKEISIETLQYCLFDKDQNEN